jgi:hypothetical protein
MHAHAYGWKDYQRVECRFCKQRFKVKADVDAHRTAADLITAVAAANEKEDAK